MSSTPNVEKAYSYGSTQINLPEPVSLDLLRFSSTLPDDLLTGDGRETQPHVTVCYGLVRADNNDLTLLNQIAHKRGTLDLQFEPLDLFPASPQHPEYDVLILPVRSPGLHRLHHAIREGVETVITYPEYKPHVPVAYLLPGAAQLYKGLRLVPEGATTCVDCMVMSDRNGVQTNVYFGDGVEVNKSHPSWVFYRLLVGDYT